MESIYTKLALYGSKNLCARTDNVFFQYLRSAMVRCPLLLSIKVDGGKGAKGRVGISK